MADEGQIGREGPGARVEQSLLGRIAIVAGIVIVLAAEVGMHLPASSRSCA